MTLALLADPVNMGGATSALGMMNIRETNTNPYAVTWQNRNANQVWGLAIDENAIDDKILSIDDLIRPVSILRLYPFSIGGGMVQAMVPFVIGPDIGGTEAARFNGSLRISGQFLLPSLIAFTTQATFIGTPGTVQNTTTSGLLMIGSSGGTYDWQIATPSLLNLLANPHGTQTLLTGGALIVGGIDPGGIETLRVNGHSRLGGYVLVPFGFALQSVNSTSTTNVEMVRLAQGISQMVLIGGGGVSPQAFANIATFPIGSFAAGGSSGVNGIIALDTTNNRFVFYVGGNRYFVAGTAF